MSASVVEFSGVTKRYGTMHAVDALSLDVREGEVLGLLGHNGAGKTTSMKMILGVTAPTAGDVRVFGESPLGRKAHELRRRVGYLPESVSFYGQMTGREVLAYFARLKGARRRDCDTLFERVGLESEAVDRRVKTYSKGMRQRLGLAQALLGEPRLLLLDEPTVGLDPIATRDFYVMLDELRRQGATVILSSHVLPGIERHIDRAAILGHGRMLAFGSLEELRERAGLPLRIRVRGQCSSDGCEQGLKARGMSVQQVNGAAVELAGPLAAKLDVLRLLLADPGVEDIDLVPPSLETLYAHISLNEPDSCNPS
jgi:Cu-processing system ATP-binding protein